MITINGAEFDFDVTCPDDMERYEAAYNNLQQKAKKADEAQEGKKPSEHIREACECSIAFFDAVLGEGAARKILGPKTSLVKCLDATTAFTDKIMQQAEEASKKLAQFSPERLKKKV